MIKGTADIIRYSSVGTGQNGLMWPLSKGMGVNDEKSRSLVRKDAADAVDAVETRQGV